MSSLEEKLAEAEHIWKNEVGWFSAHEVLRIARTHEAATRKDLEKIAESFAQMLDLFSKDFDQFTTPGLDFFVGDARKALATLFALLENKA